MVTALPLAAAGATRVPTSLNLNKDARITKAGDKAGDGDSMRVAARRRRSTARHRGCRLQGGGSCTPPAAPAAAEPASSAAAAPTAPGELRRDRGGIWVFLITIIISRGAVWKFFFYYCYYFFFGGGRGHRFFSLPPPRLRREEGEELDSRSAPLP